MEEIAKPGFLPRVAAAGNYLAERLTALSDQHQGGGVRGRGLLLALDLGHKSAAGVAEEALQRGLLLNAPRPDCLRFMPALTVTRAEIDQMIEILEEALGSHSRFHPRQIQR